MEELKMKDEKKKNKRRIIRIISTLFMSIFGIGCSYLIYNILLLSGIEDIIRYIAVGFIVLLFIAFLFNMMRLYKKRKMKALLVWGLIITLIGIIFGLGGFYIQKAYSSINNMNKATSTYSTSLVVLSNSGIDNISDLKNKKIGISSDKDSVEGYIISYEIIKEKKISEKSLVQYDDFLTMLNDLYSKKIDAVFISGGYVSMFSTIENFEKIKTDTKVLTTKNKTIKKEENKDDGVSYSSSITKPFTMLVMGVDTTETNIENATSFNGDSLILVTFNPKTLNATMVSIPRDTFVPIMCFANHKQNKITHAAWYGESCMEKTIENFTGIDIDYYVKINFKGVVTLVDALGGVEVDVPYSFCEQDSNRNWGKATVYVNKGLQTLTGEQALAFARNRHPNPTMCKKGYASYYSDDFVRGQNQQTVIKAMVNKLKTIRDINKLYEILDLIEQSMDTNLTTNQILSFYNIGKAILSKTASDGEILDFEKLYLKTYGAYIYDESMRLELSDQIYYKGSLDDIVKAMKINLGLIEPTVTKEFSFSVNDVYEEKVIGKGTYSEAAIALVPNFIKYTKASATTWGIKNGVNITFNTIQSSSSSYYDGQITGQSLHVNSLVSIAKTKGITLNIISKTSSTNSGSTTSKLDCTDEDNKDESLCTVPNFIGKDLSYVKTWASKLTTSSVSITYLTENTTDKDKSNIVYTQTGLTSGDNLYSASSNKMTITSYVYKPDDSGTTDPTDDLLPSSGE
jgi:LCP family protein required for cell wall assembly